MRKIIYFLAIMAFTATSLCAYDPADQDQSNDIGEPGILINHGSFKEFKAHNSGISSLRVTEDGKRIISISGNEYKVWNAETGANINRFTVPGTNAKPLIIINDSLIISISSYSSDLNQGHLNFKVYANIYNINNNSILWNFTPFDCYFNGIRSFTWLNISATIQPNSNLLYLSMIYQTHEGGQTQSHIYLRGEIRQVELNDGSVNIKRLGDIAVSKFSFIGNNRIAAISECYSAGIVNLQSYYYENYHIYLSIFNDGFISPFTVRESYDTTSYYGGKRSVSPLITNFKLLSSKNTLVECLEDSIFYFRNMDNFGINDSCILPARTSSYEFSLNENFLITGYKNGIYIYSAPQLTPVDSFYYNYPINNWSFSVYPDTVTFAAGSSDGYIRLFRSEALRGGPVSVNDPTERNMLGIVYPNPAENELFFQKNEALLGSQIEIYSPTGVKFLSTPYAERVDISALPAGMYFVKVGARYGKFIKN